MRAAGLTLALLYAAAAAHAQATVGGGAPDAPSAPSLVFP